MWQYKREKVPELLPEGLIWELITVNVAIKTAKINVIIAIGSHFGGNKG